VIISLFIRFLAENGERDPNDDEKSEIRDDSKINRLGSDDPGDGGTKKKRKKRIIRKNSSQNLLPSVPKIVPPPAPLASSDRRRLYGRLLLSTLNSCDISKVRDIFTRYLTEDVVSIRYYEGKQNPNGRMIYHISGRNSLIQFYDAAFKASPDLFFTIGESTASFSSDWKVVISTTFDIECTRIADMRISKNHPEEVERVKLEKERSSPSNAPSMFEQKKERLSSSPGIAAGALVPPADYDQTFITRPLATYIPSSSGLTSSYSTSSLPSVISSSSSCSSSTESSPRKDAEVEGEESTFLRSFSEKLTINPEDRIYISMIPLEQAMKIQNRGIIHLTLNDEAKITSFEMRFIAIAELEERHRQLQNPSTTAIDNRSVGVSIIGIPLSSSSSSTSSSTSSSPGSNHLMEEESDRSTV
jgi:hypothetical protein